MQGSTRRNLDFAKRPRLLTLNLTLRATPADSATYTRSPSSGSASTASTLEPNLIGCPPLWVRALASLRSRSAIESLGAKDGQYIDCCKCVHRGTGLRSLEEVIWVDGARHGSSTASIFDAGR